MRSQLAKFYFIIALLFLGACSNRPETSSFTNAGLPPGHVLDTTSKIKGLWVGAADFRGMVGSVSRLDLETGEYHFNVLATGTDIQLVPDSPDTFFLLFRNGSDSVNLMRGPQADLVASYPLADYQNPQVAARDRQNRVWVSSMQTNIVEVLSPDLSTKVGQVDLSALKDEDSLAEVYGLAPLGADSMVAVAARLRQPMFIPSTQSGMAVINTNTLQVTEARFLNIQNAVQIHSIAPDSLLLVGMGPQSSSTPGSAGLLQVGGPAAVAGESVAFNGRIIHSALSENGVFVASEWYPAERKNCVRYGMRNLVCESHATQEEGEGFIFLQVASIGNTVFASHARKGQNDEIWVIPTNGGAIRRLQVPHTVTSLVPGP